jgi:phosphoglycerate dehydrogenase-like enzyme
MSSGPVIASQWGPALTQLLLQRRPDARIHKLERTPNWPLPDEARVLLVRPFLPQDRQQAAPPGWPFGLRWVQLISVGFETYPRWLLDTPGVHVSTAHGTSSEVIAEFALASILRVQLRLAERRVHEAAAWRQSEAPGIAGGTLGLFGFGGIGQALARKALALGMRVKALRRSAAPLGVPGVERARDLGELLATSEHLVLAAPGTAETRGLIDAAALAKMKPGAHLVNLARGALVDQDALRAALDSGQVGWASLDVCEPEPLPEGHWLYTHPRVWLTPHTSAFGPAVSVALADKVVRGLAALERGETPEDPIDLARGY